MNIDPSLLAKHAQFFKRRGYAQANPYQPDADRSVLFTFDDAYLSAVENAPTAIEPAGYKGVFFAVSNLVGQSSTWDGDRARPLADWPSLQTLISRGHWVANHTHNHPSFANLSLAEQISQLEACASELTARGGTPDLFCFPYGHCNADSSRALTQAGMKVGFLLGKRWVRPGCHLLTVPRFPIGFSDRIPLLYYKIFLRGRWKSR